MSDDPWWAPIRNALVKKIAKAIEEIPPDKAKKLIGELVVDVEAEDIPPERSQTHRKGLSARLDTPDEPNCDLPEHRSWYPHTHAGEK